MSSNGSRFPVLSVIIPTFNNLDVLKRCLESWQRHAMGQSIEILVIEDGCKDSTPAYLADVAATDWGRTYLRWFHEDDVHEQRCTNRGFAEGRGQLFMAWQDDMFLQADWFVPELLTTFKRYSDLGLLCLSRGLDCFPAADPITTWEELIDGRRLRSTIGPRPLNWCRLQEVDLVIRPWVVRRACIEGAGPLDQAFHWSCWDEADLSFRLREHGWKVATHGYERLGAFLHLGSTTVGRTPTDVFRAVELKNGLLFHERWDHIIARDHARARRTWWRSAPPSAWLATARRFVQAAIGRRR